MYMLYKLYEHIMVQKLSKNKYYDIRNSLYGTKK